MHKDLSAPPPLDRLASLQLGIGGRALTCATCLLAAVAGGLEAPELPPFLIFLGAATIAALLAGWRIGAAVALASATAWWVVFRPSPGLLEMIGFAGMALLDMAVVAAFRDAVARLRARQDDFGAQLAAERAMLTELDHRLSNTMQSIVSGLDRQARAAGGAETRLALNEAMTRVASFARIHRRVSQPGTDIGGFLDALCHDLAAAFGVTHVRLSIDCDAIELEPRRAETLALIVAELLTNALKHAFPQGADGKISVGLRRSGPNCILEVRDDGVGMEAEDGVRLRGSLGLGVVRSLARRLGGTVNWSGIAGTVVTVEFRP